eukprot:jgi/Ulvmu1/6048/UM027_0025.1
MSLRQALVGLGEVMARPSFAAPGFQARRNAMSTSYLKPFQTTSNQSRFPSPFAGRVPCKKNRGFDDDKAQPWKAVPLTQEEEDMALKADCSSMLSTGHGQANKKAAPVTQ